ncbi:hypothetical protein K474DRAFT_716841 [Panus rudis PR-1116 ss-1]|nr:hypothetical protein K474DRAFT_716841 [Panus rudis PR-1116 ss-1]
MPRFDRVSRSQTRIDTLALAKQSTAPVKSWTSEVHSHCRGHECQHWAVGIEDKTRHRAGSTPKEMGWFCPAFNLVMLDTPTESRRTGYSCRAWEARHDFSWSLLEYTSPVIQYCTYAEHAIHMDIVVWERKGGLPLAVAEFAVNLHIFSDSDCMGSRSNSEG